MGVLVDIESHDLLLPRAGFGAALRALRRLAKRRPSDFAEPDAIVEAADFEEALANADFRYEKNESGDVVSLGYAADKLPSGADELWLGAFCEALAPFVRKGTLAIAYDGERTRTVYRFARKKVTAKTATEPKKKMKAPARSKAAAAFDGEPTTYAPLPEDSAGVCWFVEAHFHDGYMWQRKRARVAKVIAALSETAWWAELDSVIEMDKPTLLVAAPRKTLSVAAVTKLVANGQWGPRGFIRRDGEVSVDFDVNASGLGLTLYARDGALARLGDAAFAGVVDLIGRLADDLGDDAWLSGYGAPTTVRPFDDEAPSRVDLPLRWKSDAFAAILDRRIAEDDDEDAYRETRALLEAKPPKGAVRTERGSVVVVRWPCDPADVRSLRDATRAQDAWLGDRVERFAHEKPRAAFAKAKATGMSAGAGKREAEDLEGYQLWWIIELRFDDRPMWYREPARVRLVIERLARTAWWREVAGAGAGAIDKAARDATGEKGVTRIATKDASVRIERQGTSNLIVHLVAMPPAIARLGRHAIADVVPLVCDLLNAFRGRATLTHAYGQPYSNWWDRYASLEPSADRLPSHASVVTLLDPHARQDIHHNEQLAATRALALLPPPPEAQRIERDGLVILTFLDDISDPERAAAASRAHSRWQHWARGQ